MNRRYCACVRIGNVGMPSSERSSSSEEFVEVHLGMKCDFVRFLLRSFICSPSVWCFLDDGDGSLGWILWLRLCSPVARSMYHTLLVEE
jgi:hypothetical protein